MIPWGAVAFAVSRAARKGQARRYTPAETASGRAAIVWFFGIVYVLMCFGMMSEGAYILVPGLPVCAILFWPWSLTRRVLVPLGWARPAFRVTALSHIAWRRDTTGGAGVAAAWALLHHPSPNAELIEQFELRLRAKPAMRGGAVVAYGLLAAGRRDLDTARALLSSVDGLHKSATPRIARKLAREWLMADAAERGDWRAVLALGRRAGPRTAISRLLTGVAARQLGEPYGVAPLRLVAWWLLSGRWPATWSLLQRGLHPAALAPAVDEAQMPPLDTSEPIRSALPLHAQFLRTAPGAVRPAQLLALGQAWDAALSDGLRERLRARSLSLALLPSEEPMAKLRETVIADLVTTVREAKLPLGKWADESELLGEVASRLREEILSAAEEMSRRLGQRVEAKRALPTIDEWREWLEVRRAYEQAVAVGGAGVRRLLFAQVHLDVSALAVWMFNKREEKPLANAMLAWLLAEAIAVDDADAIKLQTKNVGLAIGL
jgi:hypothetical protein